VSFFRHLIPEISHTDSFELRGTTYSTITRLDGSIFCAFEINHTDSESSGSREMLDLLAGIVKALPKGCRVRIYGTKRFDSEISDKFSRASAIRTLGAARYSSTLVIERTLNGSVLPGLRFSKKTPDKTHSKPDSSEFVASLPCEAIKQLCTKTLDESELRELFYLVLGSPDSSSIAKSRFDSGDCLTGIIKLTRFGANPIDAFSLASSGEQLSEHVSCLTLSPLEPSKAEFLVRGRAREEEAVNDRTSQEKVSAVDEVLSDLVSGGNSLSFCELQYVFKARSEQALREELSDAKRALRQLGDFEIETVGVLQSLVAFVPGSQIHCGLLEQTRKALYLAPVFHRGSDTGACIDGNPARIRSRSLVFHRQDHSLEAWDLFDARRPASNTIVTGVTGSGKSVFCNLLTQALLKDPEIEIFKADFGGSYTKECALFGGEQHDFSPSEPSNLNLFSDLLTFPKERLNDLALTISTFLGTLILEKNESALPNSIQSEVERAVQSYIESPGRLPSLEGFAKSAKELPRRELLQRWCGDGVFSNAFKSSGAAAKKRPRYRYLNLKGLEGVSHEEYAAGIFAGIIAHYNLEILRIAESGQTKRLVFFCDETPVFIKRNGGFFKLTAANARKFGHATVLIAQSVRDFILNQNGGQDLGIIENSFNRVFFTADSALSSLSDHLGLSPGHLDLLRSAKFRDGARGALIADPIGVRLGVFRLTREEYWTVTSSFQDRETFKKLLEAVPGLTTDQAIRALSLRDESAQGGANA
jgi:hypothetical protein